LFDDLCSRNIFDTTSVQYLFSFVTTKHETNTVEAKGSQAKQLVPSATMTTAEEVRRKKSA
jgi:hypothetical protein